MSADSENMSKLVGIFSPVAPPHTVKYYVIYVRVLFNFFFQLPGTSAQPKCIGGRG
jgi:hypothetical protein